MQGLGSQILPSLDLFRPTSAPCFRVVSPLQFPANAKIRDAYSLNSLSVRVFLGLPNESYFSRWSLGSIAFSPRLCFGSAIDLS
jgi:hypothetical protein